jgi:ribokinase
LFGIIYYPAHIINYQGALLMASKFYDIITMGSATIDVFVDTGSDLFKKGKEKGVVEVPFGSKIVARSVFSDVGGGATNTAVAFSRMGFKAAMIIKVGDDANGRDITEKMKEDKVDTHFVSRSSSDKTGFSLILDADGKDRTIILYKGVNNDIRMSDVKLKDIKTRWFYFSSMLGESFKTMEKLCDFARKNNIRVAFNPSSYLAKMGIKYLKRVLDATDVLVLNAKEAEYLSGKIRLEDMLKALYKVTKGIVVITLGDKGALAYDGKKVYTIKSHKVKVVETTGAGDAFAAGFVAGIIKTDNIDFALKVGRAQAESVITHFGAKNKLLGFPTIKKLIEAGE